MLCFAKRYCRVLMRGLVVWDEQAFVNMLMRDPKFEVEPFPEVDRAVITPAEQRKMMEHNRDGDRAYE